MRLLQLLFIQTNHTSSQMKVALGILILSLAVVASQQPTCLLDEPLTNQCIESITLSLVTQQITPYLCIIATERQLYVKAEQFCREATSFNIESGYRYFQALLMNSKFQEAFKAEYMLFFSNPFTHNNELLSILNSIKFDQSQIQWQGDANFAKSIFYFYSNQTEKSLSSLKIHLEAQKESHQLFYQYFLMARIYQKQYQYYDGLNYITEVIKKSQQVHPYLYHLKGNFLMHHIQYQKAITEFERSNTEFHKLYHSNGFSFSNYNLGLCYEKIGKVQDAVKYYEKSIINLNSAEALNALGHAHFSIYQKNSNPKQLEKSQLYYKKSIQANPEYTIALFNLGMLELVKKQAKKAVEYFTSCLSKQQSFRSCTYGLLKAFYAQKQLDKVAETISQVQKTEDTITELAAILYSIGDYKRALALFSDGHIYKSSELMQWKGFNQYSVEKYEEAEKSFSRAIFLGSKKGYIYYSLGLSQLELKKYSECARSFDHAYRIDPRQETKAKLQQCQSKIQQHDL